MSRLNQPSSSSLVSAGSSYPGLQNSSSSNLCFLNSVIQALASITQLHTYLNQFTVPLHQAAASPSSSLILSLIELFDELNLPRNRKVVLRPTQLIQALISTNPNSSRLFDSSQQDAHEVLIIIIESIDLEVNRLISKPSAQSLGLSALLPPHSLDQPPPSATISIHPRPMRSPFRALMAHRIACASCGFSAGIRHSPTDILSVNLPASASCTLEDCLKEYTILELLDHYVCRKCTLINAENMLKLQISAGPKSKRKRVELKANLAKISDAIKHHPEVEFEPGLEHTLLPVPSPKTTKQTMFARPSNVLTFHISRSTLIGYGQLTKNYCRLEFPEILILDGYTTTQTLSALAEVPISEGASRTGVQYPYRLVSAIVHQGNHSSGHYLSFRRAPGSGTWWRVSDDDVDRCPVTEVLHANPTVLIYQTLGLDHPLSSLS